MSRATKPKPSADDAELRRWLARISAVLEALQPCDCRACSRLRGSLLDAISRLRGIAADRRNG